MLYLVFYCIFKNSKTTPIIIEVMLIVKQTNEVFLYFLVAIIILKHKATTPSVSCITVKIIKKSKIVRIREMIDIINVDFTIVIPSSSFIYLINSFPPIYGLKTSGI